MKDLHSFRKMTFHNISGAKVRGLDNKTWVTVEVRLYKGEQGLSLSICGTWGVGNNPNSEREMQGGGQCVREIAAAFPKVEPYLKFHLNDMNAGCAHQRALGWKTCPGHYGTDAIGCSGQKLNAAQRIKYRDRSGGAKQQWRCSDDKLGKPCPTCGYAYGTSWLFEPLPPEVIEWAETFGNKVGAV